MEIINKIPKIIIAKILINSYLNYLTFKCKANSSNLFFNNNSSFKYYKKLKLFFYLYKNYVLKNKLKLVQYNQYNFYSSKKVNKQRLYQLIEPTYDMKNKINHTIKSLDIKMDSYLHLKKLMSKVLPLLNPLPKVIVRMNKRNCFITICNYDNTVIRNFSLVNLVLKRKAKLHDMLLNFLQARYFIGFFKFLEVTSLN